MKVVESEYLLSCLKPLFWFLLFLIIGGGATFANWEKEGRVDNSSKVKWKQYVDPNNNVGWDVVRENERLGVSGYGYKKLVWDNKRRTWISPETGTEWFGGYQGYLIASHDPIHHDGGVGIYITKSPHDAVLNDYKGTIVKIWFTGAVEFEYGYVATYAQVVEEVRFEYDPYSHYNAY